MALTQTDILARVRESGIVGAGGAGFPTHVKLGNKVDTIIANGSECEPIIEADRHLMIISAPDIVRGLVAAMDQVGAAKGIIAIKVKNTDAIASMERAIEGNPQLSVSVLGDYYPAGDEIVLIRQVTGRIVEPGSLPFTAGVTVINVTTLKQISDALDGKNVVSRLVTIAGAVARPVTVEVPIGTSVRELIEFAGGATIDEYVVITGGPIMGPIESADLSITKTIGGIIVLPTDNAAVILKQQPVRVTKLKAKMCCTCQECTILCPRNALGHPISPARIMTYSWHIDEIIRKIESGELDDFTEQMVFESFLCCQCGICEQYACIFGLSPNKVYALVKAAIMRSGLKYDFSKMQRHKGEMFDYRKLPAKTLARKLELYKYLGHFEFKPLGSVRPLKVRIPLYQHIGAQSVPVVKTGDSVRTGDLIGDIPDGALGARVHASIDGRIADISDGYVVIEGAR